MLINTKYNQSKDQINLLMIQNLWSTIQIKKTNWVELNSENKNHQNRKA